MKRVIKKTVAFMLFLAMTMQLFFYSDTVRVNAATNSSDFVIYDDYLSGYTGTDKDVEIPGDLGITTGYISEIETLVIPEGVQIVTIFGLENLKKITLPSTLSSIDIEYCPKLTSLDLSKASFDGASYIDLFELDSLSDIKASSISGWLTISSCNALKSLDFSNSELESCSITYCDNISGIKLKNAKYVQFINLSKIKNVTIPENASEITLLNIDLDKVTIKNNENGFYIENGGLYQNTKGSDGIEPIKVLKGIDTTKKTIDVSEGTKMVDYLCLSGSCYITETINLPDSLEQIAYAAFYGGESIKNLSIPKNVITLSAYAFSGVSADLVIPKSVRFIADEAFSEYLGKLTVEANTEYVEEFKDGIYFMPHYDNNEATYSTLIYYPSDKTSITFKDNVDYISKTVFKYSSLKKLNIPEGVSSLSLDLSNAYNLKSITAPSTIVYCSDGTLASAPALTNFSISKKNKYYSSYKNCLYDKEMTTLLDVPASLENIEIPEGVISLGYYVISSHYVDDESTEYGYRLVEPVITVSQSASEENYEYISFKKAYVYADTNLAAAIKYYNDSEKSYAGEAEYYEPYLLDYEFRDTNKDLLNMIWCVDTVTVKKGGKETAQVELPLGMDFVSKLTLNKNTECKVKFSSSDKSIAKVNSKTGVITGVKKGTCTINVKCTVSNGKKTNSKSFKIKVKVK